MSETLKAVVVDAMTGQVIEREFTANEILEIEKIAEAQAEQDAQLQAKADARESALAKLAALGLTQDEINAL